MEFTPENFDKARKSRGLTMEQAADEAGVSHATLRAFLKRRGEQSKGTLDKLRATLARWTGESLAEATGLYGAVEITVLAPPAGDLFRICREAQRAGKPDYAKESMSAMDQFEEGMSLVTGATAKYKELLNLFPATT